MGRVAKGKEFNRAEAQRAQRPVAPAGKYENIY